MIEDVVALTVGFRVQRCRGRQISGLVLHGQMPGRPTRACDGAPGLFKDVEEVERDERIVGLFRRGGAQIPGFAPDLCNSPMNLDLGLEGLHAEKPSKITLSQCALTASHCSGSRTVHPTIGMPLARSAFARG